MRPTHVINFEADSADDGDEFLFKLVCEGVLTEEDYPALWPRGDEFLVYGDDELAKVQEIAGDALETGVHITDVSPYVGA